MFVDHSNLVSASTIIEHRDLFKYCSLRFDAPAQLMHRGNCQVIRTPAQSLPGPAAAMSSAGPAPFRGAGARNCPGAVSRSAR